MKSLVKPLLSVLIGVSLGVLVAALLGESPLLIFRTLISANFGTAYDFGMMLSYATPLVFAGLAVIVPFRAGLFNIGGEGQLYMGALVGGLGCLWIQSEFGFLSPAYAILMSFLGGATWGALAGWLRASRGSHEVITTIMMNFISASVVSYFILEQVRNRSVQNPESLPIPESFRVSIYPFFEEAPVSSFFFLAVLVALIVWMFFKKTRFGFEMTAVGRNESAARTYGISEKKVYFWSMFWGGGLAGLVGANEILAVSGKLVLNFSPGFGFLGIAVALLARGNPLGVIPSALLFALLHKGSGDLDFESELITRDLALVFQAFVLLAIAAEGFRRKGASRV